MSTQPIISKKSRGLTMAKVARAVGIFVLGCVVFATKHAIQNSQNSTLVRRSADLVYNSAEQKAEKSASEVVAQKLKMEPKDDFSLAKRYIIEAQPSSFVNTQNPRVRETLLDFDQPFIFWKASLRIDSRKET